jgi:hypothetical protein
MPCGILLTNLQIFRIIHNEEKPMSASIESLLKADQRDNSVPDEKQAQEFIEICRSGDVKQVAERLKVSPSLANVCNAAGLSVLMCVIKGKKKQRDDDDDEEEEEEDRRSAGILEDDEEDVDGDDDDDDDDNAIGG